MICPRCGADAPDDASSCPSCGSSLAATIAAQAIATGEVSELDVVRQALSADYDVRAEIGRGGMAVVYRAVERQLGREVAVKVLPFSLVSDPEFVERFDREARTAAQLEHPNVVPIYRVGRQGRVIYFVMKYLRGESLASLIKERGKLPLAHIRRLLAEVGEALGYAARRGVVHRDIKPENIMFDEHGHAVVTDFGIAKVTTGRNLTGTGFSIGTPHYMSPEQARAQPIDGRSDIYSLGVVAYQCLVGRVPYDGEDAYTIGYQHIMAPIPEPELTTQEERELFAIVRRMLAKDPDERVQNGGDLVRVVAGESVPARTSEATKTEVPQAALATVPIAAGGRSREQLKSEAVERLRQLRVEGTKAAYSFAAGAAKFGLVLLDRGSRGARWTASIVPRHWHLFVQWTSGRGARFWILVATVGAFGVGAYSLFRFALLHRSRCLQPPRAVAETSAATTAGSFSVLLDPVGALRRGSKLELYYDVCGLESGTQYRANLLVTRNEDGAGALGTVRKLLGGSNRPLSVSFDDRTDGSATRRHRSIELGQLEPGSYRVTLVVTDDRGRRRERSHAFVVTAP